MKLIYKYNFAWILAIIMLVSVSSCKKSTYYQLTDEEMAWLVYKNYEVLTFTNQNGDELKYFVTIRVKSYEQEGDTYSEFTSASFQQLEDTTALFTADSQGQHYMFKGADGFLVTLTWPHFPLKKVPLTGRTPTSATIAGINYYDIFLLDGTPFTDLRFYVSKLWVSQTVGVLQFEDTSGNIWIRTL